MRVCEYDRNQYKRHTLVSSYMGLSLTARGPLSSMVQKKDIFTAYYMPVPFACRVKAGKVHISNLFILIRYL